ncbi:MAG: Mobile element protein, partial [uncultured Thermomicrobiales bacterium]
GHEQWYGRQGGRASGTHRQSGVPAGDRRAGGAGDPRGGDDGAPRRRALRAERGAERAAQRLQAARVAHAGRHADPLGAAGSREHLLDPPLRPLSAPREGPRPGADGDVRGGGLDPQGGRDHRSAVRDELLQEPGVAPGERA